MMQSRVWFCLAVVVIALSWTSSGCKNWGTKIERDSCELYFKEPVDDMKALDLLDYLEKDHKYCEGKEKKILQIRKPAEVYQFRRIVNPGVETDEVLAKKLAVFGRDLST